VDSLNPDTPDFQDLGDFHSQKLNFRIVLATAFTFSCSSDDSKEGQCLDTGSGGGGINLSELTQTPQDLPGLESTGIIPVFMELADIGVRIALARRLWDYFSTLQQLEELSEL